METITLIATALSLAKPFLEKIGEGTSRKIGEDIWNLLKKPFKKKNMDIDKMETKDIEFELVKILKDDPNFKNELESVVINAQTMINSVNQNINNNGSVEKQINISNNTGNITL